VPKFSKITGFPYPSADTSVVFGRNSVRSKYFHSINFNLLKNPVFKNVDRWLRGAKARAKKPS